MIVLLSFFYLSSRAQRVKEKKIYVACVCVYDVHDFIGLRKSYCGERK